MPVTPPLPLALPIGEVKTHKHAIVQSVDVSVSVDYVCELRFEPRRLPYESSSQFIIFIARDLEQLAADAVGT